MATAEGLGASAAYALDPAQTPHTYLELGALPTAVPCARLHVKHVLREWHMQEMADTVELIVSELVTNAMRASAGLTSSRFAGHWAPGLPPVRLWLASDGQHAVVQVWDANDQHAGPPACRARRGERAGPAARRVPRRRVGVIHPGRLERQGGLGGDQ